jgi:hypothetical protein
MKVAVLAGHVDLDSEIGPGGEELSGGQRRRLGIAQAYLRHPGLLLLHEPTEGLDHQTARALLENLRSALPSLGLPVAGYFVGAKLGGPDAGMVTAAAVVWLTVAVRKLTTRSVPGLLTISALVLTLQTAAVMATGSALVFLLQFPLANLALCVLFAGTAPTRKPLVAQLAAEVVALRQPSSHHPGLDRFFQGATWLWAGIFAISTVGLAALMAIESVKVFLLLTTAITIGGVVAGTFLSALWFTRVLRRSGLRIRFTQA